MTAIAYTVDENGCAAEEVKSTGGMSDTMLHASFEAARGLMISTRRGSLARHRAKIQPFRNFLTCKRPVLRTLNSIFEPQYQARRMSPEEKIPPAADETAPSHRTSASLPAPNWLDKGK